MLKKGDRCFGTGKPYYEKYHDHEWGIPVHDDRLLFEMLCLEGAQAGLSWETILVRREEYRKVFYNFDPELVSGIKDKELEELLKNPGIIRNRRKVFSVRNNAKVVLKIQKEFGSLDSYLWSFVNNMPIVNNFTLFKDVPAYTPVSIKLSNALKKEGMNFVGKTIIYAFMQAVGMVNDHLEGCPYR